MLTTLCMQAEFLGTLLFVFASATVSSSLAVGMAYAVASYATAGISGGHLNPGLPLVTCMLSAVCDVYGTPLSAARMLTAFGLLAQSLRLLRPSVVMLTSPQPAYT